MGKMIAPFFVKQLPNDYETIHDMVDSIRSQLAGAYGRTVAIANSTKFEGIQKLSALQPFVGIDGAAYSANLSAGIEDFYTNLTIDRNDYFGNRKNVAMWYRANSYRGLHGFVDDDDFDPLPQSSYIRQGMGGGKLQIPVGLLGPPLFHDNYPECVKFGGMGAMIAHRYTSALNIGEESFGGFRFSFGYCDAYQACQHFPCYFDLHNSIIGGVDHEIYSFTGELFPNSVGLQQSFDAWKTRSLSDRNGTNRNPALQGLTDFTPEQLFFISFGNSLCETRWKECEVGCNPPVILRKFRINLPVANSADFARVFNCAANATMNPTSGCNVLSEEPYHWPEEPGTFKTTGGWCYCPRQYIIGREIQ
ncbi:Neprilysin-4 [Mortierella alpina]|nr:Neprilysin-4 [Mortierella alpina]